MRNSQCTGKHNSVTLQGLFWQTDFEDRLLAKKIQSFFRGKGKQKSQSTPISAQKEWGVGKNIGAVHQTFCRQSGGEKVFSNNIPDVVFTRKMYRPKALAISK